MIVFLPFLRDTKKASGSRSEKRYSQRELCCGGLPRGNFQGNGNVECGMSWTWKRGQSKNSKQWREEVFEKGKEGHQAPGGTTDQ